MCVLIGSTVVVHLPRVVYLDPESGIRQLHPDLNFEHDTLQYYCNDSACWVCTRVQGQTPSVCAGMGREHVCVWWSFTAESTRKDARRCRPGDDIVVSQIVRDGMNAVSRKGVSIEIQKWLMEMMLIYLKTGGDAEYFLLLQGGVYLSS